MDMSNSLISSGFKSPILTPASQTERQARLPAPNQTSNLSKNPSDTLNDKTAERSGQANSQSSTQENNRVNSAEFIKKGEAIQAERFQRLNSLESAPLKGQQAVSSYQQTIEAAKQYEEGELVGIDLYI